MSWRFIVGGPRRCWGEEEEEVGGIWGPAWAMHEGNEQVVAVHMTCEGNVR